MDKSFTDLFEEQVLNTPGNIAVVFEKEEISYRELNERSNKLAHYLRSKGVGNETLVPLYIERGVNMLVGMLGIMKAGAAYVPIDTDFPTERIKYMLQDTAAAMVVSSKESGSKLPGAAEIDIIEIESIPGQSVENLKTKVLPAQLAYVIYTSGSTGMPKGVMVEHRNLVDYVTGLADKTQITQCRSFALVSTIATDLGNTVIYASLISGGALHLFSKESVSNIELLHRYFALHQVECLKIVPSHWKALKMDDQLLLPAKLLIFGGEALQEKVVEDIRATGTACRIVNHYGPTETTIGKLLYMVEPGVKYEYTVPVGKPFSKTKVLVLTNNLKLCPIGVPGQLYITGDGVARGYLNNAALTKEKFIQNPFSKQADSVMYSTGDLVKCLADGNLTFIGRADNQVKIRGYRIELGEIESVLHQCNLVNQAVVLAKEDKQGEKKLVGYIVPEGTFDREGMLAYLKDKLPDYMIPAVIMELQVLPLTANGKVDRKSLPDPDVSALISKQYVAPRNEVEAKLAAIWQDVLEAEQVGVNDDFFELGGHSLLAVRLISVIRKAFVVEMPIADIFDHPTVALLAAQLVNQADTTILPTIEKSSSRPAKIPLSFSQERLWFIDQLGGSLQYHVPAVLKLSGKLNKEALAFALQNTVNRHEVLRTVYQEEEGLPYQVIKEKNGWELLFVDGKEFIENEPGLQNYIRQQINTVFNLSEDYMLRAALISLEEDEFILVVTLHHIASDGWSKSVLVNDFVAFYRAYEEGTAANLPELPVQYADFAIWQRNYLKGPVLEEKIGYWKEKLQGVAPLQLPVDYVRPAIQSTKGSMAAFDIDKALSASLQSLSQHQGTTLFMTLLAALKVLLYRYTGQQDICVGTPIAGRQQQEVEGLIGFFVNTLALRTDVKGEDSFVDLLQQVRTGTLAAYEHQEIPFEKVVEAVTKERDMSRSPIFQVMFVLRNTPEVPELIMKEVTLSRAQNQHTTALFDITFYITENEQGLLGAVEYSTDLFAAETIERMMDHYSQLLISIVADPLQKIGMLPMLSKLAEQHLLVDFNKDIAKYPTDKTIVDLIEEQVEKFPSAIAVVFEKEQLTYRQLNERSNQLAHYLQKKGITAESLVPICLGRGIEMIIGIVAILKAGGAYVPIDPAYPDDRIQFMVEDTGATLIIGSNETLSRFNSIKGIEVIKLDEKILSSKSTGNLQVPVQPHHLAYVIYTSGSTGKPKGVLIEHRNVVRLFKTTPSLFDFNEKDVWSVFHSFCFDFSVWEMYGALFFGGKMVVVPKQVTKDVTQFAELLIVEKVTVLNQTPSAFYVLQEAMVEMTKTVPMRYVIFGGEALNPAKLQPWMQSYPDCQLINMYGITETTVHVTFQQINWQHALAGKSLIGKPIPTLNAYIVDNHQNPVPIGVAGELLISGAGLARGYLNRPELTAEKFIANPFSKMEGTRMYRTGDLGRWLPDGSIEYMGRIDEQVKIRGYRIELGEIENELQQSGLVIQSVVLANENKEGTKRLIGYIVPGKDFTKEAVTDFLRSKLPEFMVPQLWVELEHLPLTSNGKVDKKALPDVDTNELAGNDYLAPRNELEKNLAETWQKLLGIERAGINDNFFELGGDSILTIQVVSRMRRLGFEMQPKDIFIHQTISRLSLALAARSGAKTTGEQGVLTGTAGLLPIQHWFLEKKQAAVSHFNQAVLLGLDKTVTENTIQQSIEELMLQHDALRFSYSRTDGDWQQEYGGFKGSVLNVDLQEATEDSLAPLVKENADFYQRQLDIEKGELIRVVLMQTPAFETHNRLLLVIHHLAIDGVSWRILLEDLELLFNAISQGQQSSLGNKSSSYRQWFKALQQYGQSTELLSQKAYWQNTIQSYQPLPVDKNYHGKVTVSDKAHHILRLNEEQTRRLLQEVPRAYHTEINDILLCALAGTLCNWGNTNKVVIGLEGHGREAIDESIDTSRTVGWFTSLYPLLLEPGISLGESEQIKSVKEQLRRVPGRGLGYGALKYINRDVTLQNTADWDIVFNYFGQFDNVVNESKWLVKAKESSGASTNELNTISEKLSVNCFVQSGELVLNWGYSTLHYEADTIHKLASGYMSRLEALIAHCLLKQQLGPVFTPSDYGLGAEITYQEMDTFLEESFNGKKRKEQVEGIYRLSGLQQGMLFHGLYDAEAGVYLDQFSCDLVDVDLDLFKLSWEQIIKGHSILRSAFYPDRFSVPVQCAYSGVTLPIEIFDYRGITGTAQALALKEFEAADRVRGFDFKVAPLMRLSLIRLTDDRCRMLWSWHHILIDGWSLPILTEEFLTTYEMLAAGKELQFKEDDRYGDFIRYIERGNKEQEEKYWRNYMKGVEQSTLLPFIGKTLERTKGVGESKALYLKFDDAVTTKIKAYSQQEHVTENTIMQGVWSCLLHRYTGNDDIVFGIIVSGRPDDLPGIEHRVGMYINTMPLHTRINKYRKIVEWLREMQQEQVASRQYQHTPFNNIQSWTGVAGDLFDNILVFQNYPVSKVISAHSWKLKVENTSMHAQNNLPLTVTVSSGEQVGVEFRYNTGLLDEKSVVEIMGHFEEALQQLINNPGGRLSNIDILSKHEQNELLIAFNDSQVEYPANKTIAELFEEQAAKTPENIAVVFENMQLSYQQLNEQSNQLAGYLKSKGVVTETLVPLYMERGLDMMVGILGILKAGAAYVPLDTDFPAHRINYMLEDTQATILLTSKQSRSKLTEIAVEIVEIDSDRHIIGNYPVTNVKIPLVANNLAYVIYTSGSTGKPKGVMIEHRSLADYVAGLQQKVQLELCRSFALVSTIATDLGNTVIYSSLLTGGALHIFSKETVSDPQLLHNYFRKHAIDCLKIVPSHWKALSMDQSLLLPARLLIFGGEALQVGLVADIRLSGTSCTVINHYGPTETTIGKLLHIVDHNRIYGNTIPIGKPFSNSRVYILSKDLKLCPVGVPGQLYIAGDGVARGYFNNTGLTKEKFITDPFNPEGKSLMYGTGDLVKFLPDGNIEFMGRVDDQVKIRGYRIELGEIESILQQCALVNQAVVLAREDKQANKRLVAYVVANGWFNRESILAYLKEKLPDYMIPAMIIELEGLPLTANGKVDRKALPDPDAGEQFSGRYIEPRNEVEAKLAAIWEDVLEIDQVGMNDDFFELGGHSLLAVRLISAIRKAFVVEIPISAVFDHPTIASLAKQLSINTHNPVLTVIEAIKPRPRRIPLSFSQERLWFIDQLEGSVQYHVPAILHLKGNLHIGALTYALQGIVNRHEILRSVILEEDGQPYQFVKAADKCSLSVVDGSTFKEDDTSLQVYLQQLTREPFDLSKDDMLRATLIKINANEHILVATLHHIASDGWSKSILVKEVVELYNSQLEDRETRLTPLEIQYADFAIWQRTNLSGEVFDKKLDYWKNKLQDVAFLQLPADFKRPAVWSSRGASIPFKIDKNLSGQLLELGQKQGATLFMTLLAAFKALLQRYSGQNDICVGTPIAGRQQIEVEELIGFFINALALRSEVNSDRSFKELLQQVRSTTLDAYGHQEVPFEKVVDAVVLERDMSRNPLFQVMFILKNTPDVPALKLGEVELTAQGFESNSTLFDITLSINEQEEGLSCNMQYSTSLYTDQTISRMIDHFTELLKSIVKAPEEKIGLLQMVSGEEMHQLLVEFNDTGNEMMYPVDNNVIGLFEAQVEATPDAFSIIFDNEKITYRELNVRANQLAHYLRNKGVCAETLVPVIIGRSVNMIVGILGILKAGGAYVPIDPAYPEERIQYMLADTNAKLVVSSHPAISAIKISGGIEVVKLDTHWPVISKQASGNLSVVINPHQLAYVIYTSGSTGKPKGVMVEHCSVYSLVRWCQGEFASSHFKIVYASTSICFDISVFEIFYTLSTGKPMRMIENGLHIGKYLANDSFVLINTVPVVIEHLLNEGTDLKNVSVINMAGEPVPWNVQQRLDTDSIEVRNLYGPTEDTVYSTVYRLKNGTPVLIGKPINNTRIYILDKEHQLCSRGLPGEICIAGAGLARGYLNRNDLTAEKFIDHPFTNNEKEKIYKTGDIGKWLPGGNIEYIGRIDEQVKIRGFRIELGEIETVLEQTGMVRQCVVMAREDKNGNKRLVGYIVPGEAFDKQAIIAHLRKSLPEYMVPAFWIELETLPLMPNGKINKKALPDPEVSDLATNQYLAPRNEVETKLVEIWQHLLPADRVGVHDNFFELGGHSMLAIRLLAAIRKKMNIELSVNDLFINPTIAGFSERFAKEGKHNPDPDVNIKHLVPIKTGGDKIPLYIVSGGGGTAIRFMEFAEMMDADQPAYVLQPPMEIKDLKEFPDTIEEIASKFIAEILLKNPIGPYALSGHCSGGIVAFEMAKQLEAMGKKIHLLAMFDSIIRTRKNPPLSYSNFYRAPSFIGKLISKAISKLNFETFLFTRHSRKAIRYKMNTFNNFIKKVKNRATSSEQLKNTEFEIFKESSDIYKTASKNYKIMPYDGEIILFYAMERYVFTDTANNIRYKKVNLDDSIKNRWKQFATDISIFEVAGDHSDMFETIHGDKFARLIQRHLSKIADENEGEEKTYGKEVRNGRMSLEISLSKQEVLRN